jgi:hypothetical protein
MPRIIENPRIPSKKGTGSIARSVVTGVTEVEESKLAEALATTKAANKHKIA